MFIHLDQYMKEKADRGVRMEWVKKNAIHLVSWDPWKDDP